MYLFVKWLHLVAIVCWMAGLLYVFRLFIYHVDYGNQSKDNHTLLKLMERRLYRIITIPSMSIAWLCGLTMFHLNPSLFLQKWMHWKLTCVLLLTLATIFAGKIRMTLEKGEFKTYSSKSLRFINEIPTLLLMIILALIVFRPSF